MTTLELIKALEELSETGVSDHPENIVQLAADRIRKLDAYKWKPIVTAPKNETQILICDAEHGEQIMGNWEDLGDGIGDWLDADGNGLPCPSHWMPLPEFPHISNSQPSLHIHIHKD